MIWLRALLLVLLPQAVLAGPVLVTSGEHPGFTRLVMQYDGPVDWQVGRAVDGYTLRIHSQKPAYDTAKAFDLIGKSRLAALWADPESGDLHLGIACACYAMPFEFRPGIVVVDLYDGDPPAGSSFENPLDGAKANTAPVTHDAATVAPYDWTTAEGTGLHAKPNLLGGFGPLPVDLATVESGLEPLRQSLLQEMGRGASQGIVDMAKPKKADQPVEITDDLSVQIHLGETPDLIIRQKGEDHIPLTAQGAECFSDAQLDVISWGANRPVAEQIGPERQGLTGEFDKPDPDAVTRTVRFQLFLGFGAEARSLIRAFPADLPDKAIWNSMAHILDDEDDPASAFHGMQDCDTAAALWAVMSDPAARPVGEVGTSAVLRAFSALPPHLRRLVGPRLVDRFLAMQDIPTATTLRDAVLRAPGEAGPEIILMQAAMSRANGAHAQAEAQLEPLATTSGPAAPEALVALVEQRVSLGQSIDFAQVQTLEELWTERKGGGDAARFQHALILARAGSGDFDRAFAEVVQQPESEAALWQILARSGPDSAVLTHATLAEGVSAPNVAQPVAALFADRFLGLGLPEQAEAWLKLDDHAPDLLRARIEWALGRPEQALALLQSDDSPAALMVKAGMYQDLNDEAAAAELFDKLGKPDQRWAALGRSGNWAALAEDGPDPWKAVATVVTQAADPAVQPTQGPLARNKALVQNSAATREAIATLLDSVKSPVSITP